MKILVINLGSTSTKVAVYENEKPLWVHGAQHPMDELSAFHTIYEQYAYRRDFILVSLKEQGFPLKFDAIMARGGLLKPTEGGVYEVNEQMKYDLLHAHMQHATNLGGLIADELAGLSHCRAFIADPAVVDELMPKARLTGIPEITRVSLFHALNSKAVSRRYAMLQGRKYEEMNLIVAHLGGGISVGAHCKGRVIDVNNALNGDGSFTPERAGTIPSDQLVELCFSGRYTKQEIKKMLCGKGGLAAHLHNTDVREVAEKAANGEKPYKEVLDSMLYNVSKQIGAVSVALQGKIDAIILTGGIAFSSYCTREIENYIGFLAPVVIMPGEDEMGALASNALAVLCKERKVHVYK